MMTIGAFLFNTLNQKNILKQDFSSELQHKKAYKEFKWCFFSQKFKKKKKILEEIKWNTADKTVLPESQKHISACKSSSG